MRKTRRNFYAEELEKLSCGKIVSPISEGDRFGLCIQKDGKVYNLWILSDDEGNAPGSFILEERKITGLF